LADYAGIQAGQEAFYKDLHSHPELSHAEHRTAGRVAEKLRAYGFTVQTGIGGTGVTGVLANGSGPTVLLRAELDALPVREDTGADYASTVTGRDAVGHEVPVAHACGHDMHMSCLLGMAKLLTDHPGQWNGTLVTLFQPGEETGTGTAAALFAAAAYPAELPLLAGLLPQIRTPVQIIAGAHDKVVPPANAEFLHQRLPHSKLDIVDAGHFTWEDAAAEYAALTTSWWDGGYKATPRTPASH